MGAGSQCRPGRWPPRSSFALSRLMAPGIRAGLGAGHCAQVLFLRALDFLAPQKIKGPEERGGTCSCRALASISEPVRSPQPVGCGPAPSRLGLLPFSALELWLLLRLHPEQSWRQRPCGSLRCWHLILSCQQRRTPWRSQQHCGEC